MPLGRREFFKKWNGRGDLWSDDISPNVVVPSCDFKLMSMTRKDVSKTESEKKFYVYHEAPTLLMCPPVYKSTVGNVL